MALLHYIIATLGDTSATDAGAGSFAALTGAGTAGVQDFGLGAGSFGQFVGAGASAPSDTSAGAGSFRAITGFGSGPTSTNDATGAGTFAAITGAGASFPADSSTGAGTFAAIVGAGVSTTFSLATGVGSFARITGFGIGDDSPANPSEADGSFRRLTSFGLIQPEDASAGDGSFKALVGSGTGSVGMPADGAGTFQAITGAGTADVRDVAHGSGAFARITGFGICVDSPANPGGADGSFRKLTGFGLCGVALPPAEGSGTFRPITCRAGYLAVDLREAIRRRLKSDPTVAAGVVDVYWEEPTAPNNYPYLVFSTVSEQTFPNTSDSWIEEDTFLFKVVAYGDEQAETLGEAAWECLRPKEGDSPLLFAEGQEITRIPGTKQRPMELPGEGPGGRDLWQYVFDYLFMIGRG